MTIDCSSLRFSSILRFSLLREEGWGGHGGETQGRPREGEGARESGALKTIAFRQWRRHDGKRVVTLLRSRCSEVFGWRAAMPRLLRNWRAEDRVERRAAQLGRARARVNFRKNLRYFYLSFSQPVHPFSAILTPAPFSCFLPQSLIFFVNRFFTKKYTQLSCDWIYSKVNEKLFEFSQFFNSLLLYVSNCSQILAY